MWTCGIICLAALPLFCAILNASALVALIIALAIFGILENLIIFKDYNRYNPISKVTMQSKLSNNRTLGL